VEAERTIGFGVLASLFLKIIAYLWLEACFAFFVADVVRDFVKGGDGDELFFQVKFSGKID